MTLVQRFEAFIRTMPGFESIDELLKGNDPHGKKRADYLLGDRQFILEQKALEGDPIEKVQRFVDNLMKKRNFLVYGTVSTDVIFRQMPDGERHKRDMIIKLSRVIDDDIANADKQTRDTREIFGLPDAVGIVVLLNEKTPVLDPDVVRYALHNSLSKKNDDGSIRYPQNVGVVFISETHVLKTPHGDVPYCGAWAYGNGEPAVKMREFGARLIDGWFKFNHGLGTKI